MKVPRIWSRGRLVAPVTGDRPLTDPRQHGGDAADALADSPAGLEPGMVRRRPPDPRVRERGPRHVPAPDRRLGRWTESPAPAPGVYTAVACRHPPTRRPTPPENLAPLKSTLPRANLAPLK